MSAAAILYEKQSDLRTNRECGAACLSMVYRSLGQEVAQAEIWPAIAKENRFGSISSTTHLMAKDALSRGFAALAFQARQPLQALRLCRESDTRAILNHRLNPELPTGHYTVLVDIDDKDVVLHDPFYGPSRRVPHADLLDLWQPRFPNSEIAGSVLIAIAAQPVAAPACWLCHTPVPEAIACPGCKESVALRPSRALGCIDTSCVARTWNYFCCPFCDCGFTLSSQAATGAPVVQPGLHSPGQRPAAVPQQNPLDLSRVFAELDKFCNYVLTIPAAAAHPEIKRQLDLLASSKEQLKLAAEESLQHQKANEERLAKMAQAAKEMGGAHRKKTEELNRPSPPLDARALGHALLKNLGLGS